MKIATIQGMIILTATLFITSTVFCGAQPICEKLPAKVTGEGQRYSVHADVGDLVSYADILCGIKLRARQLCAMEMISFDASAKVYDFNTSAEITMTAAFFVVPESLDSNRIVAFKDKNGAEIFIAEHGGRLLDFYQLVEENSK